MSAPRRSTRPGPFDVPGLVLLLGSDIDQDRVPARQPLAQLLATDDLNVLAEVVACRPLDLGESHDRGITQGDPQAQRVRPGDLVPDARAPAFACDHASRVKGLKVLGDV